VKLCLLTFNLGRDFELDELLEVCDRYGYEGVECRAQANHGHGIELDTTAEESAEIKEKFAAARVNLAGISTGARFESLDPEERQKQIDISKQFIDLAADVGAPRIRVFGNAFPEGADKDEVVENVGHALREIAEHAEGTGVDCNLEMHGDFYRWQYTLRAVEIADHDRIGIVYNCDRRETAWGPISTFIEPVAQYLRHVHLHDIESPDYPYQDLFRILRNMGYGGYLSLEASPSEDPERVLGLYARLYEAMHELA
jgi:sugar phosphate isomerase/epimerase